MKLLIITLTSVLLLSLVGCIYQPDIQQGNIYTPQQVAKLRPGMTLDQVKAVMGEPTLIDTFDPNRWTYVYTFQRNGGKIGKKSLTLYFKNQQLVKIDNPSG